jgi:hypothetical protein
MAVTYGKYSPYVSTSMFGNYLDIASIPNIPPQVDDITLTINNNYENRPDLLAFDLYGDANLWWVFAIRNPNIIKDPVFDMKPGTIIYIPKQTTIVQALG